MWDGNRIYYRLYLYDGVVLLLDDRSRLGQFQFQLVGHSAFQRFAESVIAEHAPFRMLDGEQFGAFRKIEPDFAHFIFSRYDSERGGEGKVGGCFYLHQGARFIVEVAHGGDKGTHVVGQQAETCYRKFLCLNGC
ncbi:hypothetical protein DW079_04995 [Segatella copri]|uniref:Uncharacterized protein n=1 Tax=Segatella copri TaxID=165179 RepID=A0A3R6IMC9_9BACT|nr:hypothetical protein DW079_04995 [Segatella copri]